ncbi:hypothetical protein TNCV_1883021 [Trichonephila clavipes]|nr:hypothetical protein TNCV_1883021 [Trichonephila clavipes]
MLLENNGIRNFMKSLRRDHLAGDVKMTSLEGHSADKRGIDCTTCMVRKYEDSPPGVSLLDSILPMQILTSTFHHFTETVQGMQITNFHHGNDLKEMSQYSSGHGPELVAGFVSVESWIRVLKLDSHLVEAQSPHVVVVEKFDE